MDLLPPLSWSPASTPNSNSYCPSEGSTHDYPSPVPAIRGRRLSLLHGSPGQIYAMDYSNNAENQPCSLNSPSQSSPWCQPMAVQAALTAGTMPPVFATDYYPLGHAEHSMPSIYPEMCAMVPLVQRPVSLTASSSPRLSYMRPSSPPAQFPMASSIAPVLPGSITSRRLSEGPMPEYDRIDQLPQYPQFSPTRAPYASIGPGASGRYVADYLATSWGQTGSEVPHYASVDEGSRTATSPPLGQQQIHISHQRRAPRRLTTREDANFQCEVEGCGKLFSRSYNYKAHMETHDDKREYPFPCRMANCTKKFVRKTDLQRHHQSVHTKERNHRCDFCGRLFARKDTLRRHMDDGCSRRFDIGTLDLRSASYDGSGDCAQGSFWQTR